MSKKLGCESKACVFGPGESDTEGCKCLPLTMSPQDRRRLRNDIEALRGEKETLRENLILLIDRVSELNKVIDALCS